MSLALPVDVNTLFTFSRALLQHLTTSHKIVRVRVSVSVCLHVQQVNLHFIYDVHYIDMATSRISIDSCWKICAQQKPKELLC